MFIKLRLLAQTDSTIVNNEQIVSLSLIRYQHLIRIYENAMTNQPSSGPPPVGG